MSRVTPGFFGQTRTLTRGNPYPHLWVRVLVGRGTGLSNTCGLEKPMGHEPEGITYVIEIYQLQRQKIGLHAIPIQT